MPQENASKKNASKKNETAKTTDTKPTPAFAELSSYFYKKHMSGNTQVEIHED